MKRHGMAFNGMIFKPVNKGRIIQNSFYSVKLTYCSRNLTWTLRWFEPPLSIGGILPLAVLPDKMYWLAKGKNIPHADFTQELGKSTAEFY